MPSRWNEVAKIRHDQIKAGIDITFNEVFKPIFIDFVRSAAPISAIEIGAGTGDLSLALSGYVENLTALEPSKGMFDVAKEVLSKTRVRLVNVEAAQFTERAKYDVAFSHLVAHCVDDFKAFIRTLCALLKPGGRLFFSIPHPCFFNHYKEFWGCDYHYMSHLFKEVSFFITKDTEREISMVPYHHRPLSFYINETIEAGFEIERFDEIYPAEEIQAKYGAPWLIPRYCTFLCRVPNSIST